MYTCPGCATPLPVKEPTFGEWVQEPWWCRDCGGSAPTWAETGEAAAHGDQAAIELLDEAIREFQRSRRAYKERR